MLKETATASPLQNIYRAKKQNFCRLKQLTSSWLQIPPPGQKENTRWVFMQAFANNNFVFEHRQ